MIEQTEYIKLVNFCILRIGMAYPKNILLDDILSQYECKVQQFWQSKYNMYCRYDYAPFCEDGFIVNYEITASADIIADIQYRIIQDIGLRDGLEKCYKLIYKNS